MSLGHKLTPYLPLLRRYARALTGAQAAGDALVRATLESIIAAPDAFPADQPRLGLYAAFQRVWAVAQGRVQAESQLAATQSPDNHLAGDSSAIAQARLAAVPSLVRQALLLSALEGFANRDVAQLLAVEPARVDALIAQALDEIGQQTSARVLIIEDEQIIAMDLESIVRDLGHDVVGFAVTRDEAVALAMDMQPSLILADIQLADDSSGIDAVADILAEFSVPIIFITAFPERLLTGELDEPTFLITKPFQVNAVKATVAQALFFDAETLPSVSPR